MRKSSTDAEEVLRQELYSGVEPLRNIIMEMLQVHRIAANALRKVASTPSNGPPDLSEFLQPAREYIYNVKPKLAAVTSRILRVCPL
jgi:hypothetical protein